MHTLIYVPFFFGRPIKNSFFIKATVCHIIPRIATENNQFFKFSIACFLATSRLASLYGAVSLIDNLALSTT